MGATGDYKIENLEMQKGEPGQVSFGFDFQFTNTNEVNFYVDYYLQFLKNNNVIKTTEPNIERVEPGKTEIGINIFDYFHEDNVPEAFQLFYREFSKRKSTLIELDAPPEINRRGGAFTLNTPKKGFFGGEKWKAGCIEVQSVVLHLEDNELSYFLNIVCGNPLKTYAEIIGSSSNHQTINWPSVIPSVNHTTQRETVAGAESVKIQVNEYNAGKWIKSLPVVEFK